MGSTAKARIQAFINSLALKPKRTARIIHMCALCSCPIPAGVQYRSDKDDRRAHEECFQAVVRDRVMKEAKERSSREVDRG